MSRDEQEMALWRRVFERWYARDTCYVDMSGNVADAAVAEFRKRYPPQPVASPAVWYDEPPFPGEYHVVGLPCVCWVDEDVVYFPEWDREHERPRIREMSRAGRRVCPIIKPQEPTT